MGGRTFMPGAAMMLAAAMAAGIAAAPATAQVSGSEAEARLPDPGRIAVQGVALPELTDTDRELLIAAAKTQAFWGAVAMSPSEGLLAEATVAAGNFHSEEAARDAAISTCDSRRPKEADPCVLAAIIRPKGSADGDLMALSSDATKAVTGDYAEREAPKAMAISPSGGEWSVATGSDAEAKAVGACNDKAGERGRSDCEVVIRD